MYCLNPSDSRYQNVYKVIKVLLRHKLSHFLLFKEFNFLIIFILNYNFKFSLKFMITVKNCRNNMSLIFSMFKTSCFAVSRKSCIMFVFSYMNLHEYSGVTVRMFASHAGVQDSIPNWNKFFHDKLENIFIKLCPAKVVLCLFSAMLTYMSTVV